MQHDIQQRAQEIRLLINSDASIQSDIQELLDFLPACEYELISFMVTQNVWQGPVPNPPNNYTPGDGTIELGLFLYWFNNPAQLNLSMFTLKEQLEILALIYAMDQLIAASQMTSINAGFFKTGELIYVDGSVLSVAQYATYDQGWFVAFLNLVETVLNNLWYSGAQFPTTVPPVISLTGRLPNTVTIAILGDCGTGDKTYQGIMNQITHMNPDYVVHVGDVYYAGTPMATSPNGTYYFSPGEEQNNLLSAWTSLFNGRSFTLNSNHEMYTGANGYFYDALGAVGGGAITPFKAQAGSSCFALQYGGWTILGLDTAYMGSTTDAFMTGSIGGAGGTQGKWISGLKPDPKKTIVLTHHNGFEFDCTAVSPLWGEINGALSGDPYAWYWGHAHNGIAYKAPITIPPNGKLPGLTTNTFTRCLGHAALPYGPASALNGKPTVWVASNLQPPPSNQLYNGFAVLTFTVNNANQLTGISESFYDLSKTAAVWTNKLY